MPKCEALVRKHEIPFEAIDMVATPPQPEQLLAWIQSSEAPLTRFFNTSGMKYRELQLKKSADHDCPRRSRCAGNRWYVDQAPTAG